MTAIEKDPYDLNTRKIFGDWLEEFGDDKDLDLAVEQRAWTKEKQDAIVWLTSYAKDMEMSFGELINAAKEYIDDGEVYCLGFDTPERVYDDNDEFWKNFELATGKTISEEKKVLFFRCAC